MTILLGIAPLNYASAREKHVQFPEKKVLRYQGEFSLTGGLTSYSINFGADILNGIRFNPYLYAGVGVGLEAGVAEWTAPIYLNIKGYAPISKRVNMHRSQTLAGILHLPLLCRSGIRIQLRVRQADGHKPGHTV